MNLWEKFSDSYEVIVVKINFWALGIHRASNKALNQGLESGIWCNSSISVSRV